VNIDNEKLIQEALDTCAQMREALQEIETARKAALRHIESDKLDLDAVRGRLDAMTQSLKNGRYSEAALRDWLDELMALFKRLQQAYRTMYRAWEAAQKDVQTAERTAEVRIIRRVIADMDDLSAGKINRLSAMLVERKGLERFAIQQEIDRLMAKYGE
jgi:DNA repair ATPase RecN